MLVALANYITPLLGGVASYMQGNGSLEVVSNVSWVKIVDISYLYGRLDMLNLLNMLLSAPKDVAWGLAGVGLNVPYKNLLPQLPRPGKACHSFFSLYIFLTLLLFLSRPYYLSFWWHAGYQKSHDTYSVYCGTLTVKTANKFIFFYTGV